MAQLKMAHLASLGVAGTLTMVTTANADTATNRSSSNEQQREAYEDFVSQLRSTYTWINQTDDTISSDYRAKRKELERARYTLMEIELLRGKLLALRQQVAQSGNTLTTSEDRVKTISELRTKATEFGDKLTELMDVLEETKTVRLDTSIKKLIRDTNMDIEKFAQINNHFEDGIIGNMDVVKRIAHDSKESNGVVIDTTETDRASLVTTEDVSLNTEIKDVTTAINGRKSVLRKISEVEKSNESEGVRAGVYRDNVEANVTIINKWVQQERERKKATDADVKRYKSQLNDLVSVQTESTKIFDEISNAIQASNQPQLVKDKLNKQLQYARNKMVGSVELSGEHTVDFGDIGRTPFEIRQELFQIRALMNPIEGVAAWKTNTSAALSAYKTDAISGITSGKLPDLQIQPLSHVIRALGIGDFKAVAHTDGDYSVKKVFGSLSVKGDDLLTKTINIPVLDLPSTKRPSEESANSEGLNTTNNQPIPIKNTDNAQLKPLTNLSVRKFGVGNGFTVRYLSNRI